MDFAGVSLVSLIDSGDDSLASLGSSMHGSHAVTVVFSEAVEANGYLRRLHYDTNGKVTMTVDLSIFPGVSLMTLSDAGNNLLAGAKAVNDSSYLVKVIFSEAVEANGYLDRLHFDVNGKVTMTMELAIGAAGQHLAGKGSQQPKKKKPRNRLRESFNIYTLLLERGGALSTPAYLHQAQWMARIPMARVPSDLVRYGALMG